MVGQKKCGGQQKKATAWWNEEIRQATKLKKQLYKKWLKDPTPQNKEQYQAVRDACKQVIKQAKERHGQSMVTNWRICEKQRR